jgi:hypothetical protein
MARFQAMAGAGHGRLLVHHFQEQTDERISEFLHSIDAGLSTMDRTLLGKSGTAAAMREHGIPVLVTRVDDADDPDRAREQVRREIDVLLQTPTRRRTPSRESILQTTAQTLLSAFELSERNAEPESAESSAAISTRIRPLFSKAK